MFPTLRKYIVQGLPPPDKMRQKLLVLYWTQLAHVTLDSDDCCEK